MERDLEKLNIEDEYQDYIMADKVLGDRNPTPMHENISKLENQIKNIKKKYKAITTEISTRKEYGSNYEILIRARELKNRERKEREITIKREKELEKEKTKRPEFKIKDIKNEKTKISKKKRKRGRR